MIQRVLSCLPRSHTWNCFCQRYTGSLQRDIEPQAFERKLDQCRKHLYAYLQRRATSELLSFSALELGTGWYPIVPVGFYLCGASIVYTVDIQPLLSRKRVRRVLGLFRQYAACGRLEELLPWVNPGRLQHLMEVSRQQTAQSAEEILKHLQVRVIIASAHRTGVPSHSVDLLVSNNTLEHICQQDLFGILVELNGLAAPGAVMSHHIDMRDHYADFDATITPYNFMRFSRRQWAFFNNSLLYQSRLRLSDYRKFHDGAGWVVKAEERTQGSVEDLAKVPLSWEFRSYSQEDLLTLECRLVSVPACDQSFTK